MKILNAFLTALFAFVLFGCSAIGVPSISSSTSEPIFVMTNDMNATIFLNFKNSANGDESVSEDIAKELSQKGFVMASEANGADFVIFGDVGSFERTISTAYNPNFYTSFGYGYGRPFWGFGARYAFGDYDEYRTRYFYILNASVLVRAKNGEEKSTNITLTHGFSSYSRSYVWPYFKQRLAKQIASLFYFDKR